MVAGCATARSPTVTRRFPAFFQTCPPRFDTPGLGDWPCLPATGVPLVSHTSNQGPSLFLAGSSDQSMNLTRSGAETAWWIGGAQFLNRK